MTTLTTRVFPARSALESALAERLARAVAERPGPGGAVPAIMLSGGTTPLPAYQALGTRGRLERSARLQILFSDDRYVPRDSPASNYHSAQPLLAALALPETAVLRVRTELALEEAALDYERQLSALLASGARIAPGLLGLGADGHTASLFGAADLERARGRLAIAVHRPDGLAAVSVTPAFLARVAEPVFVVAGPEKRSAVRALRAADPALIAWRAVAGCEGVELWIDPAASEVADART
ncbi:MAG TPA: 6-phosphogluconolactonase [Steroidobacteraceae bacterium]|jgi:6-phosphogluconolactonase|nr:6-phosphogluconolactonase [Steroidobacteraceae bacterium]